MQDAPEKPRKLYPPGEIAAAVILKEAEHERLPLLAYLEQWARQGGYLEELRELKAFRDKLQAVSGSWGSGRLLAGTAFSAVWTDDGRLAVGAVRPDVIYQALNK